MPLLSPFSSIRSPGAMVSSADQLATQAGLAIFAIGGNAVDAAIATNAAIAVTAPHLCGMGGDLFAIIHHDGDPQPMVLNASGRAGSGASADAIRNDGHALMPFRHDIRTVTVPGCVHGWMTLHEQFATLPRSNLLAPAIRLAAEGFPASPLLVGALMQAGTAERANLHELASQATHPGALVRRPGVALALEAVALHGRDGFYGGPFGEGLLEMGAGWFDASDLDERPDWVDPLGLDVWGHRLWTVPPNSQGYLTLAAAWIAEGLDLPDDTADPRWAHLMIEAAVAAGYDRPDALFEGADGDALIAASRLLPRRAAIDPERASGRWAPSATGDTTYLCTIDRNRMGVSLIQSNAAGFGSGLVEANTGINLHNRGLGFNLTAGHPAEIAPGRRPPHTLCPAMITKPDGSLVATIGTMGGDAQPQILLQAITRLLRHGQSPAQAIGSGRWALAGPETGFDTWTAAQGPLVDIEGHAPETWAADLATRGHRPRQLPAWDSEFGHAHCIMVQDNGTLAGAADPRTRIGTCAGL
jgi:gamma-glutamyltranspeptidase / glutathione hydrolase